MSDMNSKVNLPLRRTRFNRIHGSTKFHTFFATVSYVASRKARLLYRLLRILKIE